MDIQIRPLVRNFKRGRDGTYYDLDGNPIAISDHQRAMVATLDAAVDFGNNESAVDGDTAIDGIGERSEWPHGVVYYYLSEG